MLTYYCFSQLLRLYYIIKIISQRSAYLISYLINGGFNSGDVGSMLGNIVLRGPGGFTASWSFNLVSAHRTLAMGGGRGCHRVDPARRCQHEEDRSMGVWILSSACFLLAKAVSQSKTLVRTQIL